MKKLPYCSQASEAAGESLFGSAPRADIWILIEYRAPWNAKAIADNALPEAALAWIERQENALQQQGLQPRTQFIKQRGRRDVPLLLAVADTRPSRQRLVGTTIPDHHELAHRRFDTLPDCDARELDPILLVCTNGRRDACCARFGGPVYDALRGVTAHNVWQTTHLGGHRLAPVVMSLPDGLCFGRLSPAEAVSMNSDRAGAFGHLRGRSAYPPPVQAAECFLLNSNALLDPAQVELVETREPEPETTSATFRYRATGQLFTVTVSADYILSRASCSAETRKRTAQFSLLRIIPADPGDTDYT